MLFIWFGAFVERSGAGQLFMDFALALAGHTSGGLAKVAVITSGLFGTVSGSAVANVMTTGAFTIPLMKRTGYRPALAGTVGLVVALATASATASATATLGVTCLAGGLDEHFRFGPARWWQRLMLIAAALVLIKPRAG